jgi:multidrug efflux pump subunit AcrA (membrane-fusion protein)
MRKTGLCGVVIATLFGAAGFLQHPSHQVNQQHQHQSASPFAEAGVNLLNSYSALNGQGKVSGTLLPDGFLRVLLKPGPTPAQIAAYQRQLQAQRAALWDKAVAEQQAAQQAEAAQQAQAAAAAQAAAEQQEARQQAEEEAQYAAQQQAAEQAEQAQSKASSTAPTGGVWLELRECESGGNYAEDSGNGYYGAYQFALSTWYGLGFSGLPSDASPATQDEAAQELQARSGWGQWPACAAELGLT